MTSSLAAQLSGLAVPDPSRRDSLLFTAKEAAALDREAFYEIGLSGLAGLEEISPGFADFRRTLFAPSSRDFSRALATADENRRLDGTVRSFLLRLSPHLPLRPARRALEWLVHRHRVHAHNVDDWIALALPHHGTDVFARMVRIAERGARWGWLDPDATAALFRGRAASSPEFLRFVSEATLRAAAECERPAPTAAIAFYCATAVGALETAPAVGEALLSAALPGILAGLASPAPDLRAAALLVAAQLCLRTRLREKTARRLADRIALDRPDPDAVPLLLILHETQPALAAVSERCLRNLTPALFAPLVGRLAELAARGVPVAGYLTAFMRGALPLVQKDVEHLKLYSDLPSALVREVNLEGTAAERLIRCIVDCYSTNVHDKKQQIDSDIAMIDDQYESSTTVQEWYSQLVRSLEVKYPAEFDTILKEKMKMRKKSSDQNSSSISEILGFTSQVVKKLGDSYLFEKIYHPNPDVRLEAVNYLKTNYGSLLDNDKKFLTDSILDRLNDDYPQVVRSILDLDVHFFLELISKEEFALCLRRVIDNGQFQSEWREAASKAIEIVCHNFLKEQLDDRILFSLIPYLFPIDQETVQTSVDIFFSPLGQSLIDDRRVLDAANTKDCSVICMSVFRCLKKSSWLPGKQPFSKIVKTIHPDNYVCAFFAVVFCSFSIKENNTPQDGIDAMSTLMEFIDNFRLSSFDEFVTLNENTIITFIQKSMTNTMPIEAIMYFFSRLISNTNISKGSIKPWINFINKSDEIKFLIEAYEAILSYRFKEHGKFYSTLLKSLLNANFQGNQEKIEFICNLILGYNLKIDEPNVLLIRSLRMLHALISKSINTNWIEESNVLFASILSSLSSSNALIRKLSMAILETIMENNVDAQNFRFVFFRELLSRREELELDKNQLPIIIYSLLSSEKTIKKSLSKPLQLSMSKTLDCVLEMIALENTPLHVKNVFISSLSLVNSPKVLETLANLSLKILSTNEKPDLYKSQIISGVISQIDASKVNIENESIQRCIDECLKNTEMYLVEEDKIIYVPTLMIQMLNQDLLDQLPLERVQVLINAVISAGTFGSNPSIITAVSKLMKRIKLDANYFVRILESMANACTEDKERSMKRKITTPSLTALEKKEWRLGVTLLEHIQNKKKIVGHIRLLPVLFSILKKCLEFEEQSVIEYVKQLLLTSILDCCQHLCPIDGPITKEPLDKIIDIELIILCIRGSQNPQTHHHALMLLSHVAFMFPNKVLQHMMAIFTFIGSSVLRQDDAYSFQIITKIIETIIPILIKADKADLHDPKSVVELEQRVIPVLRIFVDAVLDIPEHRRFPLFKKLMLTLDPNNFLWNFLCLIFESHVVHGLQEKNENELKSRKLADKDQPVRRLDFAMSLTLDFTPDDILNTCNRLMIYLKTLPEEKPEQTKKIDSSAMFSFQNHTAKQFRHFKYTIVTFLNGLLSSPILMLSIDRLPDKSIMEQSYKNFIVNTLAYIQTVSKIADLNIGKPQGKYWKVMLHHCYEVLENTNNLLSIEMFATVIRGLMNHNLVTVKRKAMEILNTKLQHNINFFSDCDNDLVFSLLEPLVDIVKSIDSTDLSNCNIKQEVELNQQTALLSLKLIVKFICQDDPAKFREILDLLIDLSKSTNISGNLRASIILCMAEICVHLKAHSISALPKLMPSLIKILKSQTSADVPDLVLLSIITATYKIIETVPLFLSPYLEKLLFNLSILSSKWDVTEGKTSPIMTKLTLIKNKISSIIAPRVLIPIINRCYDLLLKKKNYKAIGPAMNVLADSFAEVSGPEFSALQQDLTSFFLSALQFRSDHVNAEDVSSEEIDFVEEHTIKALVALVLKLSESSFRPLYYKIYDWSTRDTGKGYKYRALTFYRLSNSIAENLRGLFILFAGHFVKNAADLLNACNITKTKELYFDDEQDCCQLVEYILKTFNSVFTYDSQNFINKERFETIMQPLVDQLDNTIGGMDSLTQRGKDSIIPCVAQFAIATADDSLWKPLNYQILLKTRHNDHEIRLLGLECMREMASKLGDSWLPLLPESVPFLAELLEDDVHDVESATQKAIQMLETVLGEPLQKYF